MENAPAAHASSAGQKEDQDKKSRTEESINKKSSPWRRDAFWTVTVDDDGDACVKNMN